MRTALAALTVGASLASSAVAQDAIDGWDLETTADGMTVASVLYEGGVGLSIQCHGGSFATAILGLPAATRDEVDEHDQRLLAVGFAGDPPVEDYWKMSTGDSVAFAALPTRQARLLRRGGTFVVRTIPGESGPPARRLEIPVPGDSAAIDRVLEACNSPTTSDRDHLPLLVLTPEVWRRFGGLELPMTRGLPAGALRRVEVSCIVRPAGELQNCRAETESIPGLGELVVRTNSNLRFRFDPAAAIAAEDRVIHIVVTGDERGPGLRRR